MRISFASLFTACFLAGTWASGGEAPTAPVRLDVALEGGPAFQPGDPIRVRLTVAPTSPREYTFTEELIADLRESVRVEGPDGVRLISGAENSYRRAVPPRVIKTSQAEPFTQTVDLLKLYPRLPYRSSRPHGIRALGVYTVVFQGHTRAAASDGAPAWSGELAAAPVTFSLVAPDADRFDLWRTVLQREGGPVEELRRALRHVEFFPLDERVRLLGQAARHSSDTVRFDVARAADELPANCAGGLNLVKSMLTSNQNPFVRAELMAALEHFPGDEARRLLVEEVRRRSERSYRAAVVVLGRIGDADCVPVLEEVAAGDATPWVRERARESIQHVQQRAE